MFQTLEAIGELEAQLALLPSVRHTLKERVQVLLALAWELRDLDGPRARTLGDEAYRLSSELGDQTGMALSLLSKASGEAKRNSYQAAFDLCEEAAALLVASPSVQGEARLSMVRGFILSRLGRYDEAMRANEQALALFSELNDGQSEGYTCMQAAITLFEQGQMPQAQCYLKRSLALFETRDHRLGQAQALLVQGVLLQEQGDHAGAIKATGEGLELKRALGERRGEAVALSNLGTIYYDLGDHSPALDYYLQALRLAETLEERSLKTTILSNIGEIYEGLGDLEQALSYFEEALEVERELGHRRLEGQALETIGALYSKMGKTGQALACFEEALALRCDLKDPQGQAASLRRLGDHYRASQPVLAAAHYEEGVRLAREVGDRATEAAILLGLAKVTVRPQKALLLLEQALTLAEALERKRLVAEVQLALCEAHERAGDYQAALAHFKRYHEVEAQLRSEQLEQSTRALIHRFELERAKKDSEAHRQRSLALAEANEKLEKKNQENQELLARLRQQAKILEQQTKEDALTGLYNRRYLELRLSHEFIRAKRHQQGLSVALIDIDDFKRINDTLSHSVGDDVLRTVAQIFKSLLRASDICARYGGEEFALIFPFTPLAGAVIACEKICQAVSDYPWQQLHSELNVTVSIGLSDDITAQNHERLLWLADKKLYEAKGAGKNMVRA